MNHGTSRALALIALGLTPFFARAEWRTNEHATWSAHYFSIAAGYPRFESPTDRPNNGTPWQTTDPYIGQTNGVYFGDSGWIGFVKGYTVGGGSSLTNSNNSFVFGAFAPSLLLPGTTNPSYYCALSNLPVAQGVTFKARFALVNPSGNVYSANNDALYFDLRGRGGAGSLAKFVFNPRSPVLSPTTPVGIEWYCNGANQAAGHGTSVAYNSIYELSVHLRAGNVFDATISAVDPVSNTLVPGGTATICTNAAISDGFSIADLSTPSVGWDLFSGNTLQPAGNYMVINDMSVVSEVAYWAEAYQDWAQRCFGEQVGERGGAEVDDDGDGLNNYAEYRAGTDPRSPASRLRALPAVLGGRHAVKWEGVAGAKYRVMCSTNLTSWQELPDSRRTGAGVTETATDTDVSSKRKFYRVEVVD